MAHRSLCSLLFLLTIFFVGLPAIVGASQQPVLCKSLEIRAPKDFELLRNCSVVVGYVRIVNIQVARPETIPPSELEEITDYLLVYRVHGLRSLQSIFPRLKLIRGEDLLYERYSLVVFENRDLENLGLISLRRVQKGALRIEKNPVLCFMDTVNWIDLLGNTTLQHISFKNKPSYQCPICNVTLADVDDVMSNGDHCWNLDAFQVINNFSSRKDCPEKCDSSGCDANGVCCSRKCLTGCSDHNCELCATYKQRGSCVDMCSFTYFQLNKRDCVTGNDCLRNRFIPHAGACLEKCPPHYEKTVIGGGARCTLNCSGSYEVHSADDLSGLTDCAIIHGSLTIELTEIKEKIIEDLEHSLGNIKEIMGYLKIKNSPQIVSLQFLQNLHTIRGNELIDDKYALQVVNNHHLEQIWHPNQYVAILKGRIHFHLNPRLCYEKIQELLPSLKSVHRISPTDVSHNSNGERVICGQNVRQLNATVEDFNSTAVRIRVNPMPPDDKDVLLGYAHFYKEAPVQNVTHYDGRHGCGHDNWRMDISLNQNIRHVISNLKPYTQYAFFVKTLTMTDYHTQIDAYSEIQYFKTLPSKPGPPAKIYYHTLLSEIVIYWWPPYSPNGEITEYVISYEKVTTNSDATTNYLPDTNGDHSREACQCNVEEPFNSGPLPEDENFYNKDQIIYDEALPDYVYVARTTPKRTVSSTTEAEVETEDVTDAVLYAINDDDNQTTSSDEKTDTSELARQTLQEFNMENERKAYAQQDTGVKDFPIIKHPICNEEDATVQYQLENGCRGIEHFDGVRVPGYQHQYTLSKLSPESSYRISIRACQANGECGGEAVITAKTISKKLEDFFKDAQTLANDIEA